jgi:hypothetical protein
MTNGKAWRMLGITSAHDEWERVADAWITSAHDEWEGVADARDHVRA